MTNYAVVQSGVVANLVAWDGTSDWQPPEGSTAVPITSGQPVSIGWVYVNGVFSAPQT